MADRRYRQRGYQDEPGGEERKGPAKPAPPKERREGPRGRGLGAPTRSVFRCAVCGARQEAAAPTAFAAVCRQCGAALHTCTHCGHFDPGAPNECSKPVPARIAAKAKANSCALFGAKVAVEFAQEAGRPADAKSAFDALFKL
jgi:hypothetical protein